MRMPKPPEISAPKLPDPEQLSPESADDFLQRGWLFYNRQEYARAENDFRQSLQLRPDDLDAYYALGLALKFLGKQQESIQIFETVNDHSDQLPDHVRGAMIKRLSKGHINQMTQGD